MVCVPLFASVALDLGLHHIVILSVRCQFCDAIVLALHPSRAVAVTDEHTLEGLSPHGLDSHIGLWHKIH